MYGLFCTLRVWAYMSVAMTAKAAIKNAICFSLHLITHLCKRAKGLFIVFVPQEHNGKFINFATIRNKTRTSYSYV